MAGLKRTNAFLKLKERTGCKLQQFPENLGLTGLQPYLASFGKTNDEHEPKFRMCSLQ